MSETTTETSSATSTHSTVCVLCSHNCGLSVDVRDGEVVAVRGDERNPVTHGYVCNKAFSIPDYIRHGQRVEQPLERRPDGSFEPISWEQAIERIATRLEAIRDRHGPRSIALVGIGGQGNHMDAPWGLGFLWGLGSRRWFNAFAQEKTQHPLVDGWMMEASPGGFLHLDAERTRYLIVLGTNPKVSNRGHNATDTFRALAAREDCTLVVVDPRETETSRGADRHLRVRPGRDAYLLTALAATIVQAGLERRDFLERRVRDVEPLRARLEAADVDALARRAGLDPAEVREVARGFAAADGASVMWDLGVEQTPWSTLNAYLMRVLLVLTGNLGRPGGCYFFESFNPPGPGRERGEPERALVSGIPAIRALGNYGMFSPNLFPEEVLADHPERIRAVVVEGANPLLSFADTERWRAAFERLELKVVIEPAMTETAELADFVLPTPVGYEKWEISNFPSSFPAVHAQLRPPVVSGPSEALPEPEIYVRLAERMGIFGPPPAPLAWLGSLARGERGRALFSALALALTARAAKRRGGGFQSRLLFWSYRTLGRTLPAPSLVAIWFLCLANARERRSAVLRVLGDGFTGAGTFRIANELFRRILDHPEGVRVAELDPEGHLERAIGYDDGKIRLSPPPMMDELDRALEAEPDADARFPLTLAAGLRTPWTANTIHRHPTWRKGKGPHCPLYIHPQDAGALGVTEGEEVRLVTRRGALTLPARIEPRMMVGQVGVPNGFGMVDENGRRIGVNLNEISAAEDRDRFTGCPHHKALPCRVERLGAEAGPGQELVSSA